MAQANFAVQAISTSALPACTYNNGTGGVGATLTASTNGAFPSIDGYSAVLNDFLCINGQSDKTQNGFYTLTTVGDGSTPWVLTRGPEDNDIESVPFSVLQGTTYQNTVWCTSVFDAYENIGTDLVSFVQQAVGVASVKTQVFTASGTYTPSAGMINAIIECIGGGGAG